MPYYNIITLKNRCVNKWTTRPIKELRKSDPYLVLFIARVISNKHFDDKHQFQLKKMRIKGGWISFILRSLFENVFKDAIDSCFIKKS